MCERDRTTTLLELLIFLLLPVEQTSVYIVETG